MTPYITHINSLSQCIKRKKNLMFYEIFTSIAKTKAETNLGYLYHEQKYKVKHTEPL